MNLRRYNEALQSFSRAVAINDESWETWTNLAAIHSQLDGWKEAMVCITQAVKRNRENWRVWENYVRIAVKVIRCSNCFLLLAQFCLHYILVEKNW